VGYWAIDMPCFSLKILCSLVDIGKVRENFKCSVMRVAESSAGNGNNMLELWKIYVRGKRNAKRRGERLQKKL
jgi:hypothetical protein